jgi:hypothetical protein
MPLDRIMLLLRGSLTAAATAAMLAALWDQSPNLWWPRRPSVLRRHRHRPRQHLHRRSEACIQAILGQAVAGTRRADLDDRIDGESDTCNPTPTISGRHALIRSATTGALLPTARPAA